MNDKVWDYRIVRSKKYYPSDDNNIDVYDEWYSIQEVYYDDDGKPTAQTLDLMIEGDTIAVMRTQLEKMINCLEESVLDESDIITGLPSIVTQTLEERISQLEDRLEKLVNEVSSTKKVRSL